MKDKEKQLKFAEDNATTVIIGTREKDEHGGTVQNIDLTPDGFTWFSPSDGLIRKMNEANVDVGDQVKIEKVGKSEKYKYGYFVVDVLHKANNGVKPTVDNRISDSPVGTGFAQKDAKAAVETHKSIKNFEKQFDTEEPDNITKLDILWKWYQSQTIEKGHKDGDELFQ